MTRSRFKYRNHPTAGYPSKKEAHRALELHLLEKAGEITELREQHCFVVYEAPGVRPIRYVADFSYKDKDGKLVVEDVKGLRTDVYKLKAKLFQGTYGFPITEV